ncbi:hypothetical protein V6Z12_A01G186000 [Gossypium hirsutum]
MYLLSLTAPFLHRKTISVWISSPSFFQNQISMVQRFPHQICTKGENWLDRHC